MPIAVKDNIDVKGSVTTVGSPIFRNHVATLDAAVIERLRAAGAVVIGKASLHEFVYGTTSANPWYGPTRNPWDHKRIPGGSSGGSAVALAADLCIGAIGSDTGGSIRIPSSLVGVVGLRPTPGSVSNRGAFPIALQLDTVGPMARQAPDVAALFDVMVAHDPDDVHSTQSPRARRPVCETIDVGVDGLRVGIPREYFFSDVEPEVTALVEAGASVLAALGMDVADIPLHGGLEARAAATTVMMVEAHAVHQDRLVHQPEMIGSDIRQRLEAGRALSGWQYRAAWEAIAGWRRHVRVQLEDVDLLLLPTTACAALPGGAENLAAAAQLGRLTLPWAAAGTPAISVPVGFTAIGLPVGMQLVAAPWREDVLFRAATAYQSVTDFHQRRPQAALIK